MKNALTAKSETGKIEKLFEEFYTGLGMPCQPKMDVKETATDIVLTAELPGVEMEDLDIVATPHYVAISGEKRAEKGEKDKDYYRLEREYGYFRRVFHMPCEVEKDRVDAVLRNGVLTVTVPKTKSAVSQERKVTVKAG